ncbi:MAG: asparaginase [Epsilonproteobacteria bacterium]|nr:asparaginase [Campylobacterota bacterium]
MLILNTGGTFNKRYDMLKGTLEVPVDNYAVERILESFETKPPLAGVVYKDSLEMDINDRKMITDIIFHSTDTKFVIIHGTDTIDVTAEFLDSVFDDRVIVLTGAMQPFSIDEVEASLNLGLAIGYAKGCEKNGVYICMNGHIEPWEKLKKNKSLGKFEIE